jgi:hypothetical protein
VLRRQLRAQLLGEGEVGVGRQAVGAHRRPAVDELGDELRRAPERGRDQHGDERDREGPNARGDQVDLPRVGHDHGDEEKPFDDRHPPARARHQVVREQQRHRDDGDHREGHRPARLADDARLLRFRGGIGGHVGQYLR